MKLATWNVNSLAVRLPHLIDWLAAHQPDVMVLQETKLTDDKLPQAEIEAAGYRAIWFGQKTYNGVALLAKNEPGNAVRNIQGFADEQARVIAATVDGIRVVGGYFPNGQAPGSEKFALQDALARRAARLAARGTRGASEAGADGRLQHRARRP